MRLLRADWTAWFGGVVSTPSSEMRGGEVKDRNTEEEKKEDQPERRLRRGPALTTVAAEHGQGANSDFGVVVDKLLGMSELILLHPALLQRKVVTKQEKNQVPEGAVLTYRKNMSWKQTPEEKPCLDAEARAYLQQLILKSRVHTEATGTVDGGLRQGGRSLEPETTTQLFHKVWNFHQPLAAFFKPGGRREAAKDVRADLRAETKSYGQPSSRGRRQEHRPSRQARYRSCSSIRQRCIGKELC